MRYEFINKAVYFPEKKILVIADLHLGYEQAMNNAGIFLPKQQFDKIKQDLAEIFSQTGKIDEIIILGDLKHGFSRNLAQEWNDVLELIEILKKNAKKIVLIKGNHDNYLINIASRQGIEVKDFVVIDEIGFFHGNKMFAELLDKKIKILIMGHMHPAITISEGVKRERYKCFLVGKWKDKEIIILPSFFPLVEGSDVLVEDTNLDIRLNLSKFEVYIPNTGEVLDFGRVKDVGRLN